MTRSLDEILGIAKTKAEHDFKVGDRVILNENQSRFKAGRTGEVTEFDEYNLIVVKLDLLKSIRFHFHHSEIDKINE